MKPFSKKILSSASMTTSFASESVPLDHIPLLAVQADWTGATATGTLALQSSNDSISWKDITGATVSIVGDGGVMFNHSSPGFKYIRLYYTAGSGTGTMSATISAKGV